MHDSAEAESQSDVKSYVWHSVAEAKRNDFQKPLGMMLLNG